MGRQVGIFFTLEDSQTFLNFALTTGNVVALSLRSPTPDFVPVNRLDDKTAGMLCLFNRDVSSNLVPRLVPQQHYYSLDILQSSVIEFSASPRVENTMFPGRIWADFTFLSNNRTALLQKEPAVF